MAMRWVIMRHRQFLIFEMKILGLLQDNGQYKRRTTKSLNISFRGVNIVRFIKSQRMRCLGHLSRMEVSRIIIIDYRSDRRRARGRAKK